MSYEDIIKNSKFTYIKPPKKYQLSKQGHHIGVTFIPKCGADIRFRIGKFSLQLPKFKIDKDLSRFEKYVKAFFDIKLPIPFTGEVQITSLQYLNTDNFESLKTIIKEKDRKIHQLNKDIAELNEKLVNEKLVNEKLVNKKLVND